MDVRIIAPVDGPIARWEDVRELGPNEIGEIVMGFNKFTEKLQSIVSELKKSQEESAAKIAAMERSAKVGDFLSDKKFVNSITHDAVKKQLADMLTDEKNAGKSLKDLFDEITKDKTDILKDDNAATPPVVPAMGGNKGGKSDDDAQARAVMGLPPKKD